MYKVNFVWMWAIPHAMHIYQGRQVIIPTGQALPLKYIGDAEYYSKLRKMFEAHEKYVPEFTEDLHINSWPI